MDSSDRLGDFADLDPALAVHARVQLGLRRADLVGVWPRCGRSADYLAAVLGAELAHPRAAHVLSTLFNEVIENAAKYAAPGDTRIEVDAAVWTVAPGRATVVIETAHPCLPEQASRMREWLHRVPQREPATQIERAAVEDRRTSGLGLLTLSRDYGARVGARIRRGVEAVTVIVRVAIDTDRLLPD